MFILGSFIGLVGARKATRTSATRTTAATEERGASNDMVAAMPPAELWRRLGLSGEVQVQRYDELVRRLSERLEHGQSLDEALQSLKDENKGQKKFLIILAVGFVVFWGMLIATR